MSKQLEYQKLEGESAEYLSRYFVSKFRKGYVKCNGVLLPEYFIEFGDKIQEMDIKSDDTWICSFPRTGTTWTQEMIWCIAHEADLKTAEQNLAERFPYLEFTSMFDNRDLVSENPEIMLPDLLLDSVRYVNELKSPRFIKSHLPFTLLPQKLQRNEPNAKIVYVTRNPRDTCVSQFHHSKFLGGYRGDFKNFCQLFLDGNVCFGPFYDHVRSFWQQRNNPNVLILKYEDMKKDLKSIIYKTADFLGKKLSEEKVAVLLDHLSFQRMKENRAVNLKSMIEEGRRNKNIERDGSFIRSGKMGEWKEVMDAELVERFRKWENENSKDLDELSITNI